MNQPPKPKGRGCVFYGCLTLVILTVVGGLTIFFGARYAYKTLVNRYTEEKPVDLPKSNMSDDAWDVVQQRITVFNRTLQSGGPAEPFTLTAAEMNEAIQRIPDFVMLRDHCHLSIVSNEILAQISFPLDQLGIRGRFLNGKASVQVEMEQGALDIRLRSLEVRGLKVPENFLAKFRDQNLAAEASKDPKNAAQLRKLESIKVEEDKVVIVPRSGVAEPVEK